MCEVLGNCNGNVGSLGTEVTLGKPTPSDRGVHSVFVCFHHD